MTVVIVIGIIVILLFAGVVAFGAPFLPTLSSRVDDAVELLNLKPGQTMLELGCGDGRLLNAVAKNKVYAIGYELNPLLVIYAKLLTWKNRKYVSVKWANYWRVDWPEADGMYVFLLNPYMSKLHNKVVQYAGNRKFTVVSFAFQIPDKKPVKENNSMFLYLYNG